jgi:multidrug resistance efflux pump
MKPLWILLGVLLLVGTVVGAKWMIDHNSVDAGQNKVIERKAADALPDEVACIGIIDTEIGSRDLYPGQPGRVVEIVEVKTKDGKDRMFKEGDVLLRVDDSGAKLTMNKAKAALRAAQKDLEKAKHLPDKHANDLKQQEGAIEAVKLDRSKIEAERKAKIKALGELGSDPKLVEAVYAEVYKQVEEKSKLEQLKLEQLKMFDPQLEIERAEADVDAKTNDWKLAEKAVDECQVKAPVAGTVLRVHAKVGEPLGANPKAPALEFLDNKPRIVRAEVLQEWSRLVKVGQTAHVIDDTYREEKWEGKVKSASDWILPKRMKIIEPFMTNDVRTMECIIEFNNQPRVLIGQRVRVKIKI